MTLWVFGYGSLLWNPGFEAAQTVTARLDGYHRSFCMLSIHHRGTEEQPGLVLALDSATQLGCTGLALQVKAAEEKDVLKMLRARELVSSAYLEQQVLLQAEDGRQIEALAYVIDPKHRQYCAFPLETQAQMIVRSTGGRGPNRDYLFNTASHLAQLGIADKDMEWLVTRVQEIIAADPAP